MREFIFRAWHQEDKVMVYDINSLRLFHGKLEPDDYILMQFTGLLDKNDNKIFEGDIIDTAQYGVELVEMIREHDSIGYRACWEKGVIIGNKFENLKLLGEQA